MSTVEIKVPDIGDFKEVEVIELLVKVGDTVKVDQSLITVESDKASMEIPSSHAGVITELKVKIGDKIAEGSLLAVVTASGDAAAPAAVAPISTAPAAVAPAVAVVAATPAPAASSYSGKVFEDYWINGDENQFGYCVLVIDGIIRDFFFVKG